MLRVLHLHPIVRHAGTIGAIVALGDQALQTHQARMAKQVWPDLAAFKV